MEAIMFAVGCVFAGLLFEGGRWRELAPWEAVLFGVMALVSSGAAYLCVAGFSQPGGGYEKMLPFIGMFITVPVALFMWGGFLAAFFALALRSRELMISMLILLLLLVVMATFVWGRYRDARRAEAAQGQSSASPAPQPEAPRVSRLDGEVWAADNGVVDEARCHEAAGRHAFVEGCVAWVRRQSGAARTPQSEDVQRRLQAVEAGPP